MAKRRDHDRPKPFAPFEWMLAGRYLRTRRREGFVSVIAGFSFLGIMLGVATLIVVLSVMNGFRKELLDKIVGINGHIFVAPIDSPLTDYAEVAASGRGSCPACAARSRSSRARHSARRNIAEAASSCAGVRGEDMKQDRTHRRQRAAGHPGGFRHERRRRHRPAARGIAVAAGRRYVDAHHPARRVDAVRHGAAHQGLSGRRRVRDRHVGVRRHLRLHAAWRGADLLQPRRRRERHRGLPRQCRPGRRGARRDRGGGRAPGPADGLAAAQPHLLRARSKSSATSCSSS